VRAIVDTNLYEVAFFEAAWETGEAKFKSHVSAKTDGRFRSNGEKSPGIRA
jgi:hypothetical protein